MTARLLLSFAFVLVSLGVLGNLSAQDQYMLQTKLRATASLPDEGMMPSFRSATAWLNSKPLAAEDLRGKVVLVDFWTYTCINWRRTVPYLRAWADKYRDQGLVVIGVHTPEFGFERNIDNVRRAAREQNVSYPIAIDSDFGVWNAFENRYWPAVYLIDARGRIRHHQFGEGDYEQVESTIQQLLADAGNTNIEPQFAAIDARGAEVGADWQNLKSPETYVGFKRSDTFTSPERILYDRPSPYSIPAKLHLNEWALAGSWTIRKESILLPGAPGKMAYRFHARDVHVVMGPAAGRTSIRFRVTLDGVPPGTSRGVDVDADGHGTLDQPRMYQLIRQPGKIEPRLIEIEFLDPGAEVFVFTFG